MADPITTGLITAGIGLGVSALGDLFGGLGVEDKFNKLRDDQQQMYGDARGELNKHFATMAKQFDINLGKYRSQLLSQFPGRKAEIQEIFSEQNPAVKRYMDNLRTSYKQAEKRIFRKVDQADADEIRRWKQAGVTGGTIGRMIAGNQMDRLERAEGILTSKMNEVLRPQSQIAQQGMAALGQAEREQAGRLAQAGQLGVMMPTQMGGQQAGLLANLAGQNLASQAQLGAAGIQGGAAQPPGLFAQAGGEILGAGIKGGIGSLFAPGVGEIAGGGVPDESTPGALQRG